MRRRKTAFQTREANEEFCPRLGQFCVWQHASFSLEFVWLKPQMPCSSFLCARCLDSHHRVPSKENLPWLSEYWRPPTEARKIARTHHRQVVYRYVHSCVLEHCLFFAQLERFGGLPLAKRMPFTAAIARTATRVHPRSKITRVETLKGRKAMKGPFDDHVWQLKHTYGTPFLMLVTMVTMPKVMLCARADRASQSGTSQDWYKWRTHTTLSSNLLFFSWLPTEDGVEHRNVLKSNYYPYHRICLAINKIVLSASSSVVWRIVVPAIEWSFRIGCGLYQQ